ncbi:MAG TPA: methyltransferase domain-containing protein [Pirellulales bacterium]|nr:methyltransferase domain-containing protein [Pirellulales bacterium]
MAARPRLPYWRLPRGVSQGLWDYFQAPHIAHDYDAYFAANSLFEFDQEVLRRHFTQPGVFVDLGAGTGRLIVPFARSGFRCLAVDLSSHMLEVIGRKAEAEQLPIDRLRANFVELGCLADASADYCICMFSTLGMVRGRENRRQVLQHVARVLKPGGKFVLHVHNRWHNLGQSEGRRWLLANFVRGLVRRDVEPGDKFFEYRGVPSMFLHVFTRRELTAALHAAGFEIEELVLLDTARRHALRWPWLLGRLRANGWIAVCRTPTTRAL